MSGKRVSKESRSRDTDNNIIDVKTVKDAMPFGYTNIDATARDVYECAKKFSELKVKSSVAPNCLKDIRTKIRLLCLFGTIPVRIGKDTYNIPISIYMKNDHPHSAPYCLVAPTNDMAIQPSRYVDTQGLLYLQYLNGWKHNKLNLTDLVQELITTFERQCPIYALSEALKVHLEIFDRELSVKRITLMTVRSNTVRGIKVMVQDEVQDDMGILPDQQTLLCRGIVLENNMKMSDYNVRNEIVLQLVVTDVVSPELCPLIPVIAECSDRLKHQLLTKLQPQLVATETTQDLDTGRQQYAALQRRLEDAEERSVMLQQQLNVERQTSEMLQAKCQHLEDTVITNLTQRLEMLERATKTIT